MSPHTLYAYVDGADLDEIAVDLQTRFAAFVTSRDWWFRDAAWVVNQRYGRETCTRPEDLPLWDLGLNLSLPNPGAEVSDWFGDVEAIAGFLGMLHREFGRDFVIGIADMKTGIADDLFFVTTDLPDMTKLRAIMGAAPPPMSG